MLDGLPCASSLYVCSMIEDRVSSGNDGFFVPRCWMGVLAGVLFLGSLAGPAQAQEELIRLYETARLQAMSEQALREVDYLLPARPPAQIKLSPGALRWDLGGPTEPRQPPVQEAPALVVDRWRSIAKLERGWFRNTFRETKWAYRGANELTTLDTMLTRELRARLQDRFGAPMQTLGDLNEERFEAQDQHVQFRYGLLLNSSIPLVALDVNGPLERGLVLATDRRYADQFDAIQEALAQELIEAAEPAPYVDYYYDARASQWYRTGFDGERYFMDSIEDPALYLGRPSLKQE